MQRHYVVSIVFTAFAVLLVGAQPAQAQTPSVADTAIGRVSFLPDVQAPMSRFELRLPSAVKAAQAGGVEVLTEEEADRISYWLEAILDKFRNYGGFGARFWKYWNQTVPEDIKDRIKKAFLRYMAGGGISHYSGATEVTVQGGVEATFKNATPRNMIFFVGGTAGLVHVYESNGFVIEPGAGIWMKLSNQLVRISAGPRIAFQDGFTDTGFRFSVGIGFPQP